MSSSEGFQGLEPSYDFDSWPPSSQDSNLFWYSFQYGTYEGYIPDCGFTSNFDFPTDQSPTVTSKVLHEPRYIPRRPQQRAKTSKPPLPGTTVLKFDVKRRRPSVDYPSSQQCKKQVTESVLGMAHPRAKRAPNGSICIKCKLHNKKARPPLFSQRLCPCTNVKIKCDNKIPCSQCAGKIVWQPICMRAKLDQTCFSKSLLFSFLSQLVWLSNAVQRFIFRGSKS